MLQRIQTLYLLVTVLLSSGIVFLVSLWTNNKGEEIFLLNLFNESDWMLNSLPIAFIISSIMSLISIFLYKNRKKQIVLNRFNIVVNFYLLGIIVYQLLIISGESKISEKGIGLFIPVLIIVFLVLANKSIIKDDKLVKSVDRLR
jgi:membrane-anchored protein YejM (alkaline phosphatase superfamily)